jgi:hypothetical protein
MLNSNKKVIGSIRIGRLIIVVGILSSRQQSLGEPTSPSQGLGVSFSIVYMRKGIASDHNEHKLFAQSRW